MKDKRELIIEAAAEVLVKENYQTMKTAKLADMAGIAEGTLYRYFKNKQEIFISVIDQLGKEMLNNFFINVSKKNTLIENIECIRINIKNILSDNKFKTIIYGKAFSEIDNEEVKLIMRDIMENGMEKIKTIFIWAKEKEEIIISEEEINVMSISFWGIGEFYIKRSIAGVNIAEGEIENVINFLYRALKNNN